MHTCIRMALAHLTPLLTILCVMAASPQLDIGNIPLMPRVPATYSLLNFSERATAFVDYILSPASAALGTLEIYTASSPSVSGKAVFDTATYVGNPPKREAFPPIETLLTAALLGRNDLDTDCAPDAGIDDCVATALQYLGTDSVINHWIVSLGAGPSVATGGQLWDFIYAGILVASLASVYPDYGGGALGASAVANALAWHGALEGMGGRGGPAPRLPDFNVSGFNFTPPGTPITEPAIYLQPSSAAGTAWLAMAARAWQAHRNASAPPLPALLEAEEWSLAYLDGLQHGFFENLLGYGALAAARANAERGARYDVGRMLGLAFQDGSENPKHGWGVFTGAWGAWDVAGTVGFVSAWDPSQPYGAGGNESYFGDGLWLAAAAAPIARYNASLARSLARWLVNLCSASRLFYPDQLPSGNQTDWGDPRNSGAPVPPFPYEALRACDYVPALGACTGPASPFGTGDYGCPWPSGPGQRAHCGPWSNTSCTNLAGYTGASVGIAAALCAPAGLPSVQQADLLATDYFHEPAYPTSLVYNPLLTQVEARIAVPGCSLVHWAASARRHGAVSRSHVASQLCQLWDSVSGAIVARGVAVPGFANVVLDPDTAYVLVSRPDAWDVR